MNTQKLALEDDPRFKTMFDVEHETVSRGHVMVEGLYPILADLRSKGSIHRGSLSVAVTGHELDDVFDRGRPHCSTLTFDTTSKVLMENELYSSELYREMPFWLPKIGHTVLDKVGKEHSRYRGAVQPFFTRVQAMTWWKEMWIDKLVDTLIDAFAGDSSADLNLQLCASLPMITVTSAYGLSPERALEFRNNLLRSRLPTISVEEQDKAAQVVRDILQQAITERRENPRDDLISKFIGAKFTDEEGNASELDDETIIAFSRLLLLAGGGTTWRQLGITLFALLSDRAQWEAVRADRKLIPSAINESVRWNCTDPVFFRLAMEDSVLDGHEIAAGTVIDVCLGAANRDPARWEDPDRYDIHRPIQRHLGFAGGPHTCLGRFVAESEMTLAINALIDRFPKLRLDDRVDAPRIIGGMEQRGVNHLRVRFD